MSENGISSVFMFNMHNFQAKNIDEKLIVITKKR